MHDVFLWVRFLIKEGDVFGLCGGLVLEMRCCWPRGYEWKGDLLGTSKFGFGVELHKDGWLFCWNRDFLGFGEFS